MNLNNSLPHKMRQFYYMAARCNIIMSNYIYILYNYVDIHLIKCNYYISQIQFYLGMFLALGSKIIQFIVLNIQEAKSMGKNYLRKTRESMLMSKTELARQANISPITISRIEKNMPCRLETQRKILLALGLKPADKHKIFKE